MKSKIISVIHQSNVLKNNPLKDPSKREIVIYLPPSYEKSRKNYPVVYLIAGFTGYGKMNMNVSAFGENIQQRLDRLMGKKIINEMIVVMPDCFTKYGGSQYVNSTATGKYEDYVIKEVVPLTDDLFRTIPKASSRCIIGKSSGGYGAMWLGMRHPDIFGLLATHSGDSAFEYCYSKDFPPFTVQIQKFGKGHKAVQNFIRAQVNNKQPKSREFFNIINILAMSACYSPNPKRKEYNFDLPFDIYTGEVIPEIWKKWMQFDPVQLIDKYKQNLKKLKMIYIDCGTRDEFNLQAGARIYADKLRKAGIKCVHEEFNDGHMNIQYRYDVSLKYISKHFSYK
ncbi:MAG: alpha/beta hydrolase [Ignavibacteria bacterium]